MYDICISQVAKVMITRPTSPIDWLVVELLFPTKIAMWSPVTSSFAKPQDTTADPNSFLKDMLPNPGGFWV